VEKAYLKAGCFLKNDYATHHAVFTNHLWLAPHRQRLVPEQPEADKFRRGMAEVGRRGLHDSSDNGPDTELKKGD